MSSSEIIMLTAVALTCGGVWGQSRMPCYCSELEEDVKDRILSGEQARLRANVARYAMPSITGVGMGLLVMGLISVAT